MELKPLTQTEFKVYLEKAIKNYGNEIFTSGMMNKEQAQKEGQAAFNRLLPDGLNTRDNYLCNAFDQNTLVGFIWYHIRGENAFIYDFYIEESKRRKGYGKKVILACEEIVKEQGVKSIGLHVFGHNKPARALYESLDYEAVSIQMRKELN